MVFPLVNVAVYVPVTHKEVTVLYPTTRAHRGVRSWWREHVTGPLDAMYAHLDEHQQDEESS